MGFLKSIKEKLNNEYADLVSTGVAAGDITNFVDTGSYILNAMLSGSIYKGIAGNKIIALAGEETTGKTFFLLGIVKNFLDSNPKAEVVIFESESSMTKDMIEQRGCDSSRIMIAPVATVQEFRTQALKVIDEYLALPENKRPPLLLGLDSLGMLSTSKEMEDTASGSETRDMTRAQVVKATFRVLTLKLGKAQVPMIVTNHVYAEQGSMYPSKIMSGGCLVADTKILMNDGTPKNIQDVRNGDKVLTMFGDGDVVETYRFEDKEVYEVTFDDGTTIKCSVDHKFFVENNWMSIADILSHNPSPTLLNIPVIEMLDGDKDVSEQQIYKMVLEDYKK